ncbi:uncharacterized protein [Struthio camelus]|uniref:uncharacterized protein isoform X2 n=1 Tax=Struthio camelus TaxID=8801 RepID=UPI003603C204
MNTDSETETCEQCGEKKCGDLIFHKLYCYDLYIPSAPAPRNKEQIDVDRFINENIVEVLENDDYCCYHGCRNFIGGEIIMQAMQKPMKIIPVTLIPVYKDQYFLSLLDMLITADKLRRIVLLLFDSTYIRPNLLQCCFSVEVNDPQLLRKIRKTIDRHRRLIPLSRRQQVVLKEMDPESTSLPSSSTGRDSPFRRSDRSRESFRPFWRHHGTFSSSRNSFLPLKHKVLPHREIEDILKEMSYTPFQEHGDYFLRYWDASNEWSRQRICQVLIRNIRRDFLTFCKLEDLESLELRARKLIQHNSSASNQDLCIQKEKLYCWILAAMFVHVSTTNNVKLKALLRGMVFVKHTVPSGERNYEYLCISAYQKIRAAISIAVKKQRHWPNFIETYLKHLESFLRTLEERVTFTNQRVLQFQSIQKQLQRVPWMIRHVFTLVITEKVFEAKLLAVSQSFLLYVCTKLGKNHWEILLEITERITEHIQASHTQGAVTECLDLLQSLWEWCIRTATKEKKPLVMTILNHFFQKLLYHPLSEVRHCIALLLFSENGACMHVTELGNKMIPADPSHVEAALQDYLKLTFPDLALKGQLKANDNSMIVQGVIPAGNVKICIAKQQTLNDILQTNTTNSDCERFQEVIRIVVLCADRESIAKLQMSSAYGVPPLYMLEDGNPLLAFLQEKRNKLTLSNMLGILKDIARAVWSCHQKRVLLCDVTPASFIVFTGGGQGTRALQIRAKLSNFLQARLAPSEDEKDYSASDFPYENIKYSQVTGDSKEPLSIYFSAPESLKYHIFSAFSDAWAIAATFYSILLYGGQTYFELRHLPVSRFIEEMCSGHRAQRPDSIPLKLWDMIAPNLEHNETERTSMEALVEHLKNYRSTLGSGLDKRHEITSQFSPICEEDIIRGYVDSKGNFKESDPPNVFPGTCEDSVEWKISQPLGGHRTSLMQVAASPSMDDGKLLACLEQVASAMAYLHSRRIIHCDLQCNYIYIDSGYDCPEVMAKVGRWGRAVCLPHPGTDDNLFEPCVRKVMPADAAKWAAPEVRNDGLYSRASDVFSFGIVIWEALTAQLTNLHVFQPLKPFHSLNSREVLKFTELGNIPGDFGFPKLAGLIGCMKACWNHNPTKRPGCILGHIRGDQSRKTSSQVNSAHLHSLLVQPHNGTFSSPGKW